MEERRGFVRIKIRLYVAYKLLDSPEVEGFCWSRDMSAAGIGLFLKEKLSFGKILELRIGLHDKFKPLVTKAKVFWQTEAYEMKPDDEKYYRTGMIFVELTETNKERISSFITTNLKNCEE